MLMTNYTTILERIKEYNAENLIIINSVAIDPIAYDESISIQDVDVAERMLGFRLCQEFKDFLLTIGYVSSAIVRLHGCMRGEDGKVEYWFIEDANRAVELMGRGLPAEGCTILEITDDEEWFAFIDHSTGKIINFDPFSEEFLYTNETVYEYIADFFVDI